MWKVTSSFLKIQLENIGMDYLNNTYNNFFSLQYPINSTPILDKLDLHCLKKLRLNQKLYANKKMYSKRK